MNSPLTEPAYEAETWGFIVRVRPQYLPDQSEPDEGRWVWAYHIEIVNASTRTAQLLSRAWSITDAQGRVETVIGPGVIGQTPTLQPGESYAYTSGCPLPIPSGAILGQYTLVDEAGDRFEIDIPAFSLDIPNARRSLN